jgi:hypothetical protein
MFFDLILNFFQKKLNGLLLGLSNFIHVFSPSFYGRWFLNFDVMFVTLIKNVTKLLLAVLTVLDLLGVWKIVG